MKSQDRIYSLKFNIHSKVVIVNFFFAKTPSKLFKKNFQRAFSDDPSSKSREVDKVNNQNQHFNNIDQVIYLNKYMVDKFA